MSSSAASSNADSLQNRDTVWVGLRSPLGSANTRTPSKAHSDVSELPSPAGSQTPLGFSRKCSSAGGESISNLSETWWAEHISVEGIVALKNIMPEDRSAVQVQHILNICRGDAGNGSVHHDDRTWPVIQNAPANFQLSLARQVNVMVIKAGRPIIPEGVKIHRSYFVAHGEVTIKEVFSTTNAEVKNSQPFHLRTLGTGKSFVDLPKGPREHSKLVTTVNAKTDSIIFSIEHAKYWSLVQGHKEADDEAQKLGLLQLLYPAWSDAGDEVALQRRDYEIRKIATLLKLKTFQPGQVVVQQGNKMSEVCFVVSGDVHIKVDLHLKEAFPGALKKSKEKRSPASKIFDGAGGIDVESRRAESLARRIEFSNSLSPRQLGIVKMNSFTFATKCRGDSIGDSHVWNDYSAYQYSAVAVTQTEIACISTLNFKNKLPSRFLALRYKLSELDHTESTNNLARLLRIESLDGWKSMLPLEDILPKQPQKMPSFIGGGQSSTVSRVNTKPDRMRVKEDDAILDDPDVMQRKLLFHTASQSMNALRKTKSHWPEEDDDEPSSEQEILSSPQHNLLFGGRDQLRPKDWAPFSPRTRKESFSKRLPYEHPRPSTAPEIGWGRGNSEERPFTDEDRVRALKPVNTPRNASVSLHPYRRAKPPPPVRKAPQPVALMILQDSNGATLEPIEQVKARSAYLAPRKVHRHRL